MKSSVTLLTLISAGLVASVPTAFVKPGPVVTADTEGVVIPNTNFGRREALVADFSKRALEIRDALVHARGNQAEAANNGEQAGAAAEAGQDKAGKFGFPSFRSGPNSEAGLHVVQLQSNNTNPLIEQANGDAAANLDADAVQKEKEAAAAAKGRFAKWSCCPNVADMA